METLTTLDIQKKVKEMLEADQTLSSYVKKFDIGNAKASRVIFPYVTVAEVEDDIQSLCIGANAPDLHNFTITLRAGMRHILSVIALEGNQEGKKGVVQLVDDLVAALYPGTIDGIFKNGIRLINASIHEPEGPGGPAEGVIVFRGIIKQ